MHTKDHWENVYAHKSAQSVSWFQAHANCSLGLIRDTGVSTTAPIIDVGAGASTLVDDLLRHQYRALTVLDLSGAALKAARSRLGSAAALVNWLEGDITELELPKQAFEVWHDRALFHFLTTATQRQRYVNQVQRAVRPGGHVIIATFAQDGPQQCSGLPVVRYDSNQLHTEFGRSFTLLRQEREDHLTPLGTIQKFVYCYCRMQGN